MDQIRNPNIAGNFQQGFAFGTEVKKQKQVEQDRNALRSLAPQIIAGDPAAYGQAAVINPEAANAYQGAGDQQLRRLSGAIDYFDQALKSGDDRLIQARFREISPFLSKVTGQPPPPGGYTPEMQPAFEQVKTKIAMAKQGALGVIQSQKISDDGFIINTYRDGRMEKTDQKVDRQAWFRDQPGMDPTIVNKDGSVITPGAGPAPAPAITPAATPAGPTVFRTSNGEMFDVSQVQDPTMQAEILSNPAAYGLLSDAGGGSVELPPVERTASQAGGGLQARPAIAPAEAQRLQLAQEANQRAAEASQRAAQAADNAQRGNAPAGFRFKPDGSLEPIPGGPKPAGATASEDERKAAGWLTQSRKAYQDMEDALALDGEADSPGVVETYVPIEEAANRSRSPARQKYVQASSAFSEAVLRAATGAGVNKDEAIQKVRELTPARGDSDVVKEQKRASLQNYLVSLEQRAGRAAPGVQPQGGQSPVPAQNAARPSTEADYNALPSGALFIDPDDGKTYRKP
jgi:hypothetical protein